MSYNKYRGESGINESTLEEVNYIEEVKCIKEEDCEMTIEARLAMGLLVVLQQEMCVALKVCFVVEFEEPDEDRWPAIVDELST
jgi:hypothetical protein